MEPDLNIGEDDDEDDSGGADEREKDGTFDIVGKEDIDDEGSITS